MPRDYRIRKETEIPDQFCPACFQRLSAATSMGGEHVPEPGDFTVCIGCGNILRFGPDKILELIDLLAVPEEVRMEFANIVSTVRSLGPMQGKYQRRPM